jgi:hypothetical protein
MSVLLTDGEIAEIAKAENCWTCSEAIAQAQLQKIMSYAIANGWGRMVEKEDTEVMQFLTEEDFQ